MPWHLAPCLTTLRRELDVQFPDRLKTSDGSIGDAAHSSRTSDHNPDSRGRVHAIDIDDDRGRLDWLAEHFRAMGKAGDPRVKYVISDRRIASRTAGWAWRKYRGANAHLKHTHLSVTTAAASSEASWGLLPTQSRPVLRRGDSGWFVRELQQAIGVQVDGRFGKDTDRALRNWQAKNGLVADGICGPATWVRIDEVTAGVWRPEEDDMPQAVAWTTSTPTWHGQPIPPVQGGFAGWGKGWLSLSAGAPSAVEVFVVQEDGQRRPLWGSDTGPIAVQPGTRLVADLLPGDHIVQSRGGGSLGFLVEYGRAT